MAKISKEGVFKLTVSKNGARVMIIAAMFNEPLVKVMIQAAIAEAIHLGCAIVDVVSVTGCFELPIVVEFAMEDERVDELVVLGYIERGDTLHGDVMGQTVHSKLVDLQVRHRKPLGNGIIGPGATLEQAELRKEAYAEAAVRAMHSTWCTISNHFLAPNGDLT